MKFLLTSMKSLPNCENPYSNPLQGACSGFLIATFDTKSCFPSAAFDSLKLPKPGMNVQYNGENRPT
jgi:hypothetical protein